MEFIGHESIIERMEKLWIMIINIYEEAEVFNPGMEVHFFNKTLQSLRCGYKKYKKLKKIEWNQMRMLWEKALVIKGMMAAEG